MFDWVLYVPMFQEPKITSGWKELSSKIIWNYPYWKIGYHEMYLVEPFAQLICVLQVYKLT